VDSGSASAVVTQRDGNCPAGGSGHGSHVAGTVGSRAYGFAKQARLLGVRVLKCDKTGTTELSIAGLDWVAKNAVKPAVVNFSMMHDSSTAVDLAARAILARGIMFVGIATNSFQNEPNTGLPYGGDACRWSPGRISRTSDAITLGSSNKDGARSSWSGYGQCVTLFAPGEGIVSNEPFGSWGNWSGTSMAAPHATGAIVRYLERNPTATVSAIRSWLLATATRDSLADVRGSPNLLLYTSDVTAPASPPPPPPPPPAVTPVARFGYSCAKFTCAFDASTSSNAQTFRWSFGDKATGAGVTISHAYPSVNKSYTVTLTVTGPGGTTATASKSVSCSTKGKKPEGCS
jgi:hypothetical protein